MIVPAAGSAVLVTSNAPGSKTASTSLALLVSGIESSWMSMPAVTDATSLMALPATSVRKVAVTVVTSPGPSAVTDATSLQVTLPTPAVDTAGAALSNASWPASKVSASGSVVMVVSPVFVSTRS